MLKEYPLFHTLLQHRAEGCLAIDCNDAGILVRVATANCKMPREIATGTNMAGSEKLYAAKRGEDVTTVPPLLVQVRTATEVKLGDEARSIEA